MQKHLGEPKRRRQVKNHVTEKSAAFTEAERFLRVLDAGASYFTFQTFDDVIARRKARNEKNKLRKKRLEDPYARIIHGTLDHCWDTLCALNAQGAGIFITINATDGKGRSTENIERVRAVFNDLDGAPLEPVLQSAHPPHIVVKSSPGKFHTYRLVSDVALDQFESLQKGLATQFGSDPGVCDLPRVMRLPGFLHCKTDPPSMVRIVSIDEMPPYSGADFGKAAAAENVIYIEAFANQTPTQQLNALALANLSAWVPDIFPKARPYHGGYRISSADLRRDLQEDLSITPGGIKDFGVHDLDDPRAGKRTPVELVLEHVLDVSIEDIAAHDVSNEDHCGACQWLCDRLPDNGQRQATDNEQEQATDNEQEQAKTKTNNKQEQEASPLEGLWLEELQERPVEELEWIVPEFFLDKALNGFMGQGAVGKDILMMQLAMAMTGDALGLACR